MALVLSITPLTLDEVIQGVFHGVETDSAVNERVVPRDLAIDVVAPERFDEMTYVGEQMPADVVRATVLLRLSQNLSAAARTESPATPFSLETVEWMVSIVNERDISALPWLPADPAQALNYLAAAAAGLGRSVGNVPYSGVYGGITEEEASAIAYSGAASAAYIVLAHRTIAGLPWAAAAAVAAAAEARFADVSAFEPWLVEHSRPSAGTKLAAECLRALLAGSKRALPTAFAASRAPAKAKGDAVTRLAPAVFAPAPRAIGGVIGQLPALRAAARAEAQSRDSPLVGLMGADYCVAHTGMEHLESFLAGWVQAINSLAKTVAALTAAPAPAAPAAPASAVQHLYVAATAAADTILECLAISCVALRAEADAVRAARFSEIEAKLAKLAAGVDKDITTLAAACAKAEYAFEVVDSKTVRVGAGALELSTAQGLTTAATDLAALAAAAKAAGNKAGEASCMGARKLIMGLQRRVEQTNQLRADADAGLDQFMPTDLVVAVGAGNARVVRAVRGWDAVGAAALAGGVSSLSEWLQAEVGTQTTEDRVPHAPRGTRDLDGRQMACREAAIASIKEVFLHHGAEQIDTPVFESRDVLVGKYGEEAKKLIFDLAETGTESLSLRYDLTVPFARFVATNGVTAMKRFQIGKVYRRDKPVPSKGRYCEFTQCDFDICGPSGLMVADAEVLSVVSEILTKLDCGSFVVHYNHRLFLDACMESVGVAASNVPAVCSTIDKLDKMPASAVAGELVSERGLTPEAANTLLDLLNLHGPAADVLPVLAGPRFAAVRALERGAKALAELEVLAHYLTATGADASCVLDLSLARGLDYYTGVVYEAVLYTSQSDVDAVRAGGEPSEGSRVGSIAGGGRYDRLLGKFSGRDVPAVGASIGIERIFGIQERRMMAGGAARAGRGALVAVIPVSSSAEEATVTSHALAIARSLWEQGMDALVVTQGSKLAGRIESAEKAGCQVACIVGSSEVEANTMQVKRVGASGSVEAAAGDVEAINKVLAN